MKNVIMNKRYGTLKHIILVAVIFFIVSISYDYLIYDKVDWAGSLFQCIIFSILFSFAMKCLNKSS